MHETKVWQRLYEINTRRGKKGDKTRHLAEFK